MSREQRVQDNWSLLTAQQSALKHKQALIVVFCLQESFLEAGNGQFVFMLQGLQKVGEDLSKLNIPFVFLNGEPVDVLSKFIKDNKVGGLISDFSPLRIHKRWTKDLVSDVKIPIWQVDAHNIVPVWVASDKQEYAARTIRPKINTKLKEYLVPYPEIVKHPVTPSKLIFKKQEVDANKLAIHSQSRTTVLAGEDEARNTLKIFIDENLKYYTEQKNDPTKSSTSGLSAYLHFGQISSQTVALEIEKTKYKDDSKVFLEELIIRKELAENYCFYNTNYDNFEGFPNWAKKTLTEHKDDKREYIYNLEDFEKAETHDDLWNAAQLEMLTTGYMHGFMRMYWAKKILEWTDSPEQAMKIAVYLNDKYQLDGRDPNGYAGIAWSIGGAHDRAWFERKVYGKIRYMNRNGAERKFDVSAYISKFIK